jgi:hypothetical protein
MTAFEHELDPPHCTSHAKPAGHAIAAIAHWLAPLQAMMHLPARQPPVHAAGQAAGGGAGSWPQVNPHAPAPVHVCVDEHSTSGSCPRGMFAQWPEAPPVLAAVHAEHVAPHAPSQQTPSAQVPEAHSAPFAQGSPFDLLPLVQCPEPSHVPPWPHGVPLAAAGFDGVPFVQTSFVHASPSTGRSLPSGDGGWVAPLPSQRTTLQSPSVCAPLFATEPDVLFAMPHVWALHVADWHAVPWFAHSLGPLHSTHAPLPSQTLPPTEHGESSAVGACCAEPFTHFSVVHWLPSSAGTSVPSVADCTPPVPLQLSTLQSPAICWAPGSGVPAMV